MLAMADQGGVDGGPGKAKKPRKRYDILKTASCTVCGDQAAEHLHYGGIACYSCRAFFRRTVNSNRPILDCSGTQNCKINKETRKRCQWCRFEKCKLVGMKTTWVLTEEDKSKLAMRRDSSPIPGINIGDNGLAPISIKKEEGLDGAVMPMSEKLRHPSSPVGPVSPPSLDPFGQNSNFNKRTSPYFHPGHDAGAGGNPFFTNQFYPFQPGFGGHKMAPQPTPSQSFFKSQQDFCQNQAYEAEKPCQQAASLFPLNINKMQVSLTGSNDGVSFTIEAHNSNNPQQRQERPAYPQNKMPGERMSWEGIGDATDIREDQSSGHHQHHQQQSRTIFRRVSNDSNTPSATSPALGTPQDSLGAAGPTSGRALPQQLASANWTDQHTAGTMPGTPDITGPPDRPASKPSNVQVWKVDMTHEQQDSSTSPSTELKSFTLQETLFVEQLTAIDERVRAQVPMDLAHVRSFLNTAVFGIFITKTTIMHAYQTCIKRIVRFANSLQDFVELPPDDMQKLLVANTVSIINIRIIRWLHPAIDLKKQLLLCGGSNELFQEAVNGGKVTEHGRWRVNYDDVFCSPWCCDSYYEDRYKILMNEMHELSFDSTIMVLLSVMCLFNCKGVKELTAQSTIASHGQKFSLLLHRYLLEQSGGEAASASFHKYQEGLAKLREMAEILINKRLIC